MKTNKAPYLDDLDRQILNILIKDCETNFLDIARICHVSGSTVHVRLKRLKNLGIIKGIKLILNTSKIGYDVCCFIGINLVNASFLTSVSKDLEGIPEIIEMYFTTGKYSIFIKVVCRNIAHLQKLLEEKLLKIQGVQNTDTEVCLVQLIDRNPYIPYSPE